MCYRVKFGSSTTKGVSLHLREPGLLGLGLEAKFSGLGLETSGLGLEAFGLGLVFLALALFKAKVKVTNILPKHSVSRYNYTNSTLVYQRHWYRHSASPRLLICCGLIEFCTRLQLQAIIIEFDLSLDLWPWP